jgi:hypothetical protein
MPLALVQQDFRLYLMCRYKGYENTRSLALQRILSATIPNRAPFERPAHCSVKELEAQGQFSWGNDRARIRLRFCIARWAGIYLRETPLSTDQSIHELPDEETLEITATVIDSPALHWWLQSFGDSVWDVKTQALEEVD